MSGLRPYQVAARDSVYREWADVRSTLLVLATGTGKTFCAGEILRERASHGRILWLAHRSELLDQARDTLEDRIGLACELEKAGNFARRDSGLFGASPVVVASVQTLRGARLEKWPREAFSTIVVDEAHHAAASTYRDILSHFARAKVLGLTATPDRGDGLALAPIFDSVAYEYGIREAIGEGYLCPIVQRSVLCDDLDLSDVRTIAGDLDQGALERKLSVEAVLHQVAAPLVELAGTRQTVVFCAGVAQAHALVEVLGGYTDPRRVAAIDGTTPDEVRQDRLARYASGEIQYIANCAVLTEGWDAPRTACVAVARPTKSRALYTQMLGRGTRIAPGKADCLVLDFVGNAGRHSLVTPIDVLAGRELPPEVRARAEQLASTKPSDEALAQAELEAVERAKRDEERRLREARIKAQVAYRAQTVDPFGGDFSTREAGPRCTVKQADYLRALGVDVAKYTPSRREAATFLDRIAERRRKGLCSYKQAKVLIRAGLSPDLSFGEARQAIDALAAGGWRATPDMVRRWGSDDRAA